MRLFVYSFTFCRSSSFSLPMSRNPSRESRIASGSAEKVKPHIVLSAVLADAHTHRRRTQYHFRCGRYYSRIRCMETSRQNTSDALLLSATKSANHRAARTSDRKRAGLPSAAVVSYRLTMSASSLPPWRSLRESTSGCSDACLWHSRALRATKGLVVVDPDDLRELLLGDFQRLAAKSELLDGHDLLSASQAILPWCSTAMMSRRSIVTDSSLSGLLR